MGTDEFLANRANYKHLSSILGVLGGLCGLGDKLVRIIPVMLFAMMLASNFGCNSKPTATIEVISSETGRTLNQQFSQAYFTRSEAGDCDLVLIEQANPEIRRDIKPRGAIGTVDAPPLTHVMHIRVLWRPKLAVRPDSPTATNSTVRWAVIADDGSGRIDYEGAGFAKIDGGADQVSAMLRNVSLKPAIKSGNLADPMGHAKVEADFKARNDPRMVRHALELLRTPETPVTPPPRSPGP